MGASLSTDPNTATNPSESQNPKSPPESPIPDSPPPNPTMSSSPDPKAPTPDSAEPLKTDDPSTQRNDNPSVNSQDQQGFENDSNRSKEGEKEEEGEEEEEGECGFCLFMKGGGCKESFIAWENCIEEAEKTKEDIVVKCMDVTATLKKCMEAHADYYEPILAAEKAAEVEAKKELEKEKVAEAEKKSAES